MMHEARAADARAVLEGMGVRAGVVVAGPDGTIAAVRADPAALETVRAAVPALKRLGFRYVALDLEGPASEAGRE